MTRRALNGESRRLEEGLKYDLQPRKKAVFDFQGTHFGPKLTAFQKFLQITPNTPKMFFDHFRLSKRQIR